MAEYVWWFLIVGIVIGGAVVALISMDFSRREEDLETEERAAEATLIAAQLAGDGRTVDRATVAEILRAHRDYRRVAPPDRFEPAGAVDDADDAGDADESDQADDDDLAALPRPRAATAAPATSSAGDRNPDSEPDEVGDHGRGGADEDLPPP